MRELDVDLYQKYLTKLENSQLEETISYQNRINDVVQAIKTGFFFDGTPLDLLEFLKRLPFTEKRSFFSTLREFMRNFNPEKEQTITDFVHENKLCLEKTLNINQISCVNVLNSKPFPPLDLKSIYNRRNIIKGYELTVDDIDCIIAYLKVRGIPLLIKAYEIAKNDYIEGKFNWDTVRELQGNLPIKKTLIPTLKK